MTDASARFVPTDRLYVYRLYFSPGILLEPGRVCRNLAALPGVADIGTRVDERGEVFFDVLVVNRPFSELAVRRVHPDAAAELVSLGQAGGIYIWLDGMQIPLAGLPVGPFRGASGRPTAAGRFLSDLAGGAINLGGPDGELFYRIDG